MGGGGADLLGGADLRHVCFSVKTNAKTKELDPVGGWGHAPVAPPGSANAWDDLDLGMTLTLMLILQKLVIVKEFCAQ